MSVYSLSFTVRVGNVYPCTRELENRLGDGTKAIMVYYNITNLLMIKGEAKDTKHTEISLA